TLAFVNQDADSLPVRDAVIFGVAIDLIQRLFAESARGAIDNAHQSDGVVRIKREFQIRDDVAHFHALVEGEAADDVVSETDAPQGFFKDARLCIGAIEDGGANVRINAAVFFDFGGDETRFGFRVESLIVAYALARRVRCPERLAL